jgi:hypothetical protein
MRHLTEKEISYIMKDLKGLFPNYLPYNMKNSYISKMINNIKSNLENELIYNDFKDIKSIKMEIEKLVQKSIIHSGESVGVISAQSIGERQTQLCIGYEQEIIVYHKNKKCQTQKIGEFIDNLIHTYKTRIRKIDNSEFLPIIEQNWKIPMITSYGKVRYVSIVECSRHKPNGHLIEIETENGLKVMSTLSHVHLIKNEKTFKIEKIKASDLKIGDKIPSIASTHITNHINILSQCKIYFEKINWLQIKNISYISENNYKYPYVYDFSVLNNQTFMLANGIFVHNTLNSFHQSGLTVATVVTGVPRFLELLNATKEPKVSSNSFCLKNKLETPSECRSIIRDSLIYFNLNDLVLKQNIFLNDKCEEYWYNAYETIYNNQFRYFNAGITFYLDIDILYKNKILISTIKDKIENMYGDVCCVISPIHIGQIDLFVDTSDIKLPQEENLPTFLKNKNQIEIYLEEVVLPKILDIDICGIRNIKNYYLKKVEEKWLVETEGSNLIEVLSLPYIDIKTVSSNNMWEIYNSMGIEATREFLIEEFTNIVSSDGTFINPSHILLLVDLMTYQGNINSISRYGMKKEQMGVLSRSSFEESLDQFCNAGFYAEKEPIHAVSANIMCGKRSKIGSGLCSLKIDWNKIENETKSVDN